MTETNEIYPLIPSENLPFRVVLLSGTWREMGRQYVLALHREMRDVLSIMLEPVRYDPEALSLAKKLYDSESYPIHRFFDGMLEAGPFRMEELQLLNAVEYVCGLGGCSALAVWGQNTGDGRLLFGRNYDYNEKYKKLNKDVAVTVFAPADGSQRVLTVGYAGEIYAVNGLNASGLFAELNNATPSGGTEIDMTRSFGTSLLLQMLFETEDLNGADRFFATHRCNLSYLIGVSDRFSAHFYEWDRAGTRTGRLPRPELFTLSNTYQCPEWDYPVPKEEHCWFSSTRRESMMRLAREKANQMTAIDMKRIMSLPLSKGGPLFEDKTVYQLVYDPAEELLHIRVIGRGGWTALSVKEL